MGGQAERRKELQALGGLHDSVLLPELAEALEGAANARRIFLRRGTARTADSRAFRQGVFQGHVKDTATHAPASFAHQRELLVSLAGTGTAIRRVSGFLQRRT